MSVYYDDQKSILKMCMYVRGTLRGGEEWVSGGGSGLVSGVRLGDWGIERVRGGLPLVECARALARLGESDACAGGSGEQDERL